MWEGFFMVSQGCVAKAVRSILCPHFLHAKVKLVLLAMQHQNRSEPWACSVCAWYPERLRRYCKCVGTPLAGTAKSAQTAWAWQNLIFQSFDAQHPTCSSRLLILVSTRGACYLLRVQSHMQHYLSLGIIRRLRHLKKPYLWQTLWQRKI